MQVHTGKRLLKKLLLPIAVVVVVFSALLTARWYASEVRSTKGQFPAGGEDARVLLDRAVVEARDSGRSVWVIFSGNICPPCERLAAWTDRHRSVLEKDLVLLTVTKLIDRYALEICNEMGGEDLGVPFHAIVDANGDVVINSQDAQGKNIGMPASESDHLRKMLRAAQKRITDEELEHLIESLLPQHTGANSDESTDGEEQ